MALAALRTMGAWGRAKRSPQRARKMRAGADESRRRQPQNLPDVRQHRGHSLGARFVRPQPPRAPLFAGLSRRPVVMPFKMHHYPAAASGIGISFGIAI